MLNLSACSVDWAIVLEFVKALAAPTATVAAAFIVAWLGVRAFRRQKAIERRVDWHDRVFRQLDRVASRLRACATAIDQGDLDAAGALLQPGSAEVDELGAIKAQAWMYATQLGVDACDSLTHRFPPKMSPSSSPADIARAARELADECSRTIATLSREMRQELGYKAIRQIRAPRQS